MTLLKRITEKSNANKILKHSVLSALLLFFLMFAPAMRDLNTVSHIIEIIILLLVPFACFVSLFSDSRIKIQLFIILVFFEALWVFGYLSCFTNKSLSYMVYLGLLSFSVGLVLCVIALYPSITKSIKNCVNNKGTFFYIGGLIVVSLVFLAFSYETIHQTPILDSAVYYSSACENFSLSFAFSTDNIKDFFMANWHVTPGYSLIATLGELVSPFNTKGIHSVHLILALISIIAIYDILWSTNPVSNKIVKATTVSLLSLIYALSPYLVGLVGNIDTDISSIYFFVILFWCYLKNWYVLEYFVAWVFINTKEPNSIYLCFFVIGIILHWIIVNKCNRELLLPLIKKCLIYLYIGLMWLAYLILGSNMMASSEGSWISASEDMHSFGFTLSNFILKFKSIYVLNFSWLFVVIIIACLIIFRKHKEQTSNINDGLFVLYSTLAGISLFNFLYIDILNPRYIGIGSIILIMLCTMYLNVYVEKIYMCGAYLVIICLCLIQSFYTIDPLTILSFPALDRYGSGSKIIGCEGYGFSDASGYSREYTYYLKMIEKMLDSVDYTEEYSLAFPYFVNKGSQQFGYARRLLWDKAQRKIVPDNTDDTIEINIATDMEQFESYDKRIYAIPFDQLDDEEFSKYREEGRQIDVEYKGMHITAYVCD